MAITDLTNTKWYIPSGWSVDKGHAKYLTIQGTLNNNPFNELHLGYDDGPESENYITYIDPTQLVV